MPEAKIVQAVQLLDLMLEHFADDGHWTRGRYDDGNAGQCLVGALLHLSRKHGLPRAPAIALLQDSMPRPGLPLVHFNDTCCGSVAELRSIIIKARHPANDHIPPVRSSILENPGSPAGVFFVGTVTLAQSTPAAPSAPVVAAICAAEILSLAGFSIVPALLPQFIEAWSLNNTRAGWLAGI